MTRERVRERWKVGGMGGMGGGGEWKYQSTGVAPRNRYRRQLNSCGKMIAEYWVSARAVPLGVVRWAARSGRGWKRSTGVSGVGGLREGDEMPAPDSLIAAAQLCVPLWRSVKLESLSLIHHPFSPSNNSNSQSLTPRTPPATQYKFWYYCKHRWRWNGISHGCRSLCQYDNTKSSQSINQSINFEFN